MTITELHGILIGILIMSIPMCVIISYSHRKELLAHITGLQNEIEALQKTLSAYKSLVEATHNLVINNSSDNNIR